VVAAAKARVEAAKEAYSDLVPLVAALHTEGLSLRAIAGKLNPQGHTTRRGKKWNPVQVARVLLRTPHPL